MTVVYGPADHVVVYGASESPAGNKIVRHISVVPGNTVTVSWSMSQYEYGDAVWGIDIGQEIPTWHGGTQANPWNNMAGGSVTWTSDITSSEVMVNIYGPTSHGYVNGVTVDTTGTLPTAVFCQYGTEKKQPAASIVDLATVIPGIILPDRSKWWALPLAITGIVLPVSLDILCSGPPFADADLVHDDFFATDNHWLTTRASDKIRAKIQRTAWDLFCKCQDGPTGSPPANQPAPTNWIQPTFYISNTTTNISNYDIAPILNFYINTAAGKQIDDSVGAYASLETPRCTPNSWDESTVHENLLGTGRFAVSNVVGFKVEVVERNVSEIVLSGQPMYLWNMGWISILADELLLDEKRVTREGYLWFPCGLQHATEFTYTLRDYTRLKVTELVKPAEIVLMG